jgi:hypothetical protein
MGTVDDRQVHMELVRADHWPADNGRHEEVRLDVGPRISSMSSAVEGMDFEEEEHAETPKLSTRGMTVAFKVRRGAQGHLRNNICHGGAAS